MSAVEAATAAILAKFEEKTGGPVGMDETAAKRFIAHALAQAAIDAALSSQEAEIERLTTALAFADEQTKKLEALLEPHIKWDDAALTPLPEGGQ